MLLWKKKYSVLWPSLGGSSLPEKGAHTFADALLPGKVFTFRGFLSPEPPPVIQTRCLILHPLQLSIAEDQWKQPGGQQRSRAASPTAPSGCWASSEQAAARAASGEEKPRKAEPSLRPGTTPNMGWTGRDAPFPELGVLSCWGMLS